MSSILMRYAPRVPSRLACSRPDWIVFALKNDTMTQMMRIAERLGWDPRPLEDCYEDVIDDPEEMML